jgi:hypothetical protein
MFGISMALTLYFAIPFGVVGAAFRTLVPPLAMNSLLILTLLVCLTECILAFTMSEKLRVSVGKKVVLGLIILGLLPMSGYFAAYVPDLFVYPDVDECYILELPTRGQWHAGHAGGSELVNYHCAYSDQVYAMDVTKMGPDGELYDNDGSKVEHYFTFGEPLYAPVTGEVVHVVDGMENTDITLQPSNKENPAGNHVVIQFEPERYVFLAHLNKGTIRVKEGDRVAVGDLLAEAGNSGNTSWPHLHMHIQDRPTIDFENAKGYPYRFAHMERNRWFKWASVANDFLVRNDRFRPIKQ